MSATQFAKTALASEPIFAAVEFGLLTCLLKSMPIMMALGVVRGSLPVCGFLHRCLQHLALRERACIEDHALDPRAWARIISSSGSCMSNKHQKYVQSSGTMRLLMCEKTELTRMKNKHKRVADLNTLEQPGRGSFQPHPHTLVAQPYEGWNRSRS